MITVMNENKNILAREILLAFWKVHILHHAADGPVYGLWIAGELRRHGYEISPGTLYPMLKRMVEHGWLERSGGGGGAKSRQLCKITPEGAKVLEELRSQIRELHREVVEEQ